MFGGGIAGLTACHELIDKGFKVNLYERSDSLGGMARSSVHDGVASEHSWRGYAPFYFNFFNISKRIPTSHHHTVYNNLSHPITFIHIKDDMADYDPKLTMMDQLIMLYHGLK